MEELKPQAQLCFPLYACSKELVRVYSAHLEKIGLTYTQYIAMNEIWEHKVLNLKSLGQYLYLDSGTTTPLIRKLESLGYVKKTRDTKDIRNILITATRKGLALKKEVEGLPNIIAKEIDISVKDSEKLYSLLNKLLDKVSDANGR